MIPNPTLSEKNAWPSASRKVFAVTFEKSGLKRKSRPAPEPGRVTERTAITTTIRNSRGISTFEYFSIPSFTPASNIVPDSPANNAIYNNGCQLEVTVCSNMPPKAAESEVNLNIIPFTM